MGNPAIKDHQPPSRESHEGVSREEVDNGSGGQDTPGVKELTEQASYLDAESVLRQMLRGDETKGDADDRDIAGATKFKDTLQGREETKNDKTGAANQNG